MYFQPTGTQTLTEFDVKWRSWHEECDRSLQDNTFASNRHLETICKVKNPDLWWPLIKETEAVPSWLCLSLSDSGWGWRCSAGAEGASEHLVSLPGVAAALHAPHHQTARSALLRTGTSSCVYLNTSHSYWLIGSNRNYLREAQLLCSLNFSYILPSK